jgi:hypothetical protein
MSNYRHGGKHTRLYTIWCGMKNRCFNPNEPAYPNYGGRGITVCDRWLDFSKFREDMGQPEPGMFIERVDNDKGYEPSNCIWADRKTQNRNKRDVRRLTINGQTKTLPEWAEVAGISLKTFKARLETGWPPHLAITVPLITKRAGVPRGAKHDAFGTERGVAWSEPNPYEAPA